MEGDVIQIVVKPEDGKCEGCGELLGEEFFETDDMVVLCKPCFESCKEDAEESR